VEEAMYEWLARTQITYKKWNGKRK